MILSVIQNRKFPQFIENVEALKKFVQIKPIKKLSGENQNSLRLR